MPAGRQSAFRAHRRAAPTTVRRLKLTSVAKVSIIFYLIVAIVFVIAVMILWSFADSTGAVRSLDKGVRTLFDLKTFTIHTGTVAGYAALAGVVLAVAGTIVNILAAAAYNIISRVAGGLRIEFESSPDPDQPSV